jgi:hypothetical protein
MDADLAPQWLRAAIIMLALAAVLAAPGSAVAASGGSIGDPIGDVTQFAADLGATGVTIGDDDTITVDTRIVPRPPALWGGCAYYVVGICVPSNMTVSWYLDFLPGAGSSAEDGADAKVVAIPQRGITTWESSRWDSANGRFRTGAKPAAAEDRGGVRWVLRLGDLGIRRPGTIRMRIVSLYKSYTGLGTLVDYSDVAGPGTIGVAGPPSAGGPSSACSRAKAAVNRLQRRIRSAKRKAKHGSRAAKRRVRRLRATRRRKVTRLRRLCGKPASGPAPTAAPPGCRLVTKPVLVQDGVGIYAEWVFRNQVVVECTK